MEYTIGKKISELRRERNMTQEDLAEAMGVSSQAVSKWETELSCPDILTLRPLAELFGVTVDELLSPDAVNRAVVLPEDRRKNADEMMLRIIINDADDKIKLNIPILLLKAFMGEDGKLNEGGNINFGNRELKLNDIDFQSIISAASAGTVGKLLEIESGDGSTVDIFIE